ncbi:MAG: site-specific DNA-methyltransferase [Acidobacteria bacterium]|nr:site-specific DNA-methyltransferase [Acidobacteriota bacterium]
MGQWDDQSVDLIYLDPPFNSKADYNILYSARGGADAQFRAFSDIWAWDEAAADRYAAYEGAPARLAHDAIVGLRRVIGPSGMLAYLTYMAERLEHMQRLLKPTGSIYLHCDPTASHYLKILLDGVFGLRAFKNELLWTYNRFSRRSERAFPSMHDSLLFYAKSAGRNTFNVLTTPPRDARRYAIGYHTVVDGGKKRLLVYDRVKAQKAIERASSQGVEVRFTRARMPVLGDCWTDISIINPMSKERLGYPTQKPRTLLERILNASSNPGDLILDPFCGCGTTIEAAQRLGRRWAGIDISSFAIDLIREKRLRDRTIPTKGIPVDLASARKLAAEQPFNFESWAVTRLPGFAPNMKQVADGGVDGRAVLAAQPDDYDSRLALAQIKGGGVQSRRVAGLPARHRPRPCGARLLRHTGACRLPCGASRGSRRRHDHRFRTALQEDAAMADQRLLRREAPASTDDERSVQRQADGATGTDVLTAHPIYGSATLSDVTRAVLKQMAALTAGLAAKRLTYRDLIADNGLPSGARSGS